MVVGIGKRLMRTQASDITVCISGVASHVDKIKYLGLSLSVSSTLDVDVSFMQRRFYSSYNSIPCKCKSSPEPVKLQLVKSYCLPYLTYCVGALELSKSNIHHLSVRWNDAFRKIFGFKRCESVKKLQFLL